MTKLCTGCRNQKSLDHFCQDRRTVDGLNKRCRSCVSAYKKSYYEKNQESIRETNRINKLKYRFNLSQDQYNRLLAEQGYGCAVCGNLSKDGKALHVDHDHSCCPGQISCGQCVRGLLCNRCNQSEGLMGGSVENILGLAAYLMKSSDIRDVLIKDHQIQQNFFAVKE